jgi:nucleoside-diphosphate-sugar epimerase
LKAVREAHGPRSASVVHLAASFDFTGEENPLYQPVNVDGIRRLLRALQAFALSQFLSPSTMLVHAPCHPGEHIDTLQFAVTLGLGIALVLLSVPRGPILERYGD